MFKLSSYIDASEDWITPCIALSSDYISMNTVDTYKLIIAIPTFALWAAEIPGVLDDWDSMVAKEALSRRGVSFEHGEICELVACSSKESQGHGSSG